MLKNYEKQLLKAYLNLPSIKLLNHQFEMDEDYLAGYVNRFLHGERFDKEFVSYENNQLKIIEPLIKEKKYTSDGKELYTAVLLTEIVCNILNKYKK